MCSERSRGAAVAVEEGVRVTPVTSTVLLLLSGTGSDRTAVALKGRADDTSFFKLLLLHLFNDGGKPQTKTCLW